jgi:folate-binding protein YgfZ
MKLIKVFGKDAHKLLNRLCTQLIEEKPCISHFLAPKGKIISTFGVIQQNDEIILEMHEKAYETFKPEIDKFVIFEDFKLEPIKDLFLTQKKAEACYPSEIMRAIPVYYTKNKSVGLTEDQLNKLRVQIKIPIFPLDYDSNFLAVESDVIQGLHFNKGCYPGQEIVSKTIWRGKSPFVLYWFEGNVKNMSDLASENKGVITKSYAASGLSQGFIRLPHKASISDLAETHHVKLTRHALSAKLPKDP